MSENNVAKRDWEDIVKESGGSLIFVPEKFIEGAKDWNKQRVEFTSFLEEAAKREVHTRLALENVLLDVKNYLAENGMSDIWSADLGFEENALREGKFILAITKQKK